MAGMTVWGEEALVQPPNDSLEEMATLVFLFSFGQDMEEEFGAVTVFP
ncbi:hypothetical protein [Streptomyces xanthochromogenes]